jgi:hypothetical protein
MVANVEEYLGKDLGRQGSWHAQVVVEQLLGLSQGALYALDFQEQSLAEVLLRVGRRARKESNASERCPRVAKSLVKKANRDEKKKKKKRVAHPELSCTAHCTIKEAYMAVRRRPTARALSRWPC